MKKKCSCAGFAALRTYTPTQVARFICAAGGPHLGVWHPSRTADIHRRDRRPGGGSGEHACARCASRGAVRRTRSYGPDSRALAETCAETRHLYLGRLYLALPEALADRVGRLAG